MVSSAASPVGSATPAETPPDYSGVWAVSEAECAEPERNFRLSSARILLAHGERNCEVRRSAAEHPNGRSIIWVVEADCQAGGSAGASTSTDMFTFSFGASAAMMQMQVNDWPPVRLVRCQS